RCGGRVERGGGPHTPQACGPAKAGSRTTITWGLATAGSQVPKNLRPGESGTLGLREHGAWLCGEPGPRRPGIRPERGTGPQQLEARLKRGAGPQRLGAQPQRGAGPQGTWGPAKAGTRTPSHLAAG